MRKSHFFRKILYYIISNF